MITAQPQSFFQQQNIVLRLILVFVLGFTVNREHLCSNQPFVTPTASLHSVPSVIHSSLARMSFDGNLSFDDIEHAARDFGNRYYIMPYAVLYPKSVSDISSIIKCIFHMALTSELTVAARGRGHSLQGQAQAYQGVVIIMESLQVPKMSFHDGELPYVDVSAGELWINILQESLKHGLAPKSWTDYLHLTVGGTLSNAGVSGQAFRHGPQINNVYEMFCNLQKTEGVNFNFCTGKGEVVTCSEDQNADLFHAVLGGLGQFGIIIQARIALEAAPKKVKWIRALYSDFSAFTKDQEYLISSENTFDYIEGFVIINRTGLLNYWRSSFKPKDPVQANQFSSEGRILFCLEVAKYFNPEDNVDQDIDALLSKLNYIKSTLFWSEVPYTDFLDRVHTSEIKLREKGLWEVPHPWLNLLIPRSRIHEFAQEVFGNIVKDTSNGPVLIYPVNKSRWKTRTSMITPDEDVFYLVAFLASAMPSSRGKDGLEYILSQNNRILEFCEKGRLGIKKYLPHYNTKAEWKAHFGTQWEVFTKRKSTHDPLAILAPGQKIFPRANALTRQ